MRQVFARREQASSAEVARGVTRGVGADDTRVTGALVWDASVVLASYLSETLGAALQQRGGEPAVQLPAGAKCIELGSGLGLALVAKIVNDHGGIIECDSRPKMTVFRTLMPTKRGVRACVSLGQA